MTRHRRRAGPGAAVALVLASTLFALGLAEIAVRALDIGPTFQVVYRDIFELADDPVLQYQLRPGAPDGDFVINSAGFRGRESTPAKAEGVFRIVAIGDSVTYGLGVARDDAWPAHLERLLNARSATAARRFEVLNLGVPGYNITQVAERLRVLGMGFRPDLVIYGYVLNDPQSFSVEGQALLDRREFAERTFRARIGRGAGRMLGWSRLFLLVRHFVVGETPPPEFQRDKPLVDPGYVAVGSGDSRGDYFLALHSDPEPLRRLAEGLDALRRTAAGVGVVVAIFPLFLDSPPGTYALARAHDQVAAAARGRAFHVTDLQPAFATACAAIGEGRCVADFMHPNALGNRVAASALLHDLAAAGLFPPGSLRTDPEAVGDPIDAFIARTLAPRR